MSVAASWRSAADWRAENLPLSTGSDRACKLYDAALTQYVTWTDEASVGGLDKTLSDILNEDPNFVMGHVVSVGLHLMSTGATTRLDPSLQAKVDNMVALSQTLPVTEREKKHTKAVKLYSQGYSKAAADVWEDILLEHPMDLLALKFAQDNYFFLGQANSIRDSVAAVLPRWKTTTPLYSYLHGMHAFGLEETNLYPQAERAARKGLDLNPKDGWATHALAHVYEMQGQTQEGITFMSTTLGNWQGNNSLACHNFWHWALYHIERGEYDAALDIFETQLNSKISKDASILDLVDCTSLLWRLQMEGVNVTRFWKDTLEACRPHLDDHILLFNDAHYLMACLGAGDQDAVQRLFQTLEEYIKNGDGDNWNTTKEFGMPLLSGLRAVAEERYSDAVHTLSGVRHDIFKMGGSHAQRDLFNIALISSAVKSKDPKDQALARNLLLARESLKGSCNLAQRLNCQMAPYIQAY